jgi:serine protease Do
MHRRGHRSNARERAGFALALGTLAALVSCGAGKAEQPKGQQTAAQPATATSASPQQTAPSAVAVTPRVQAPDAARSISAAFSRTARAVGPSVVRIDVQREAPRMARAPGPPTPEHPFLGTVPPSMRRFFFDFGEVPDFSEAPAPAPRSGTGSGFLLDTAGNILTNSHVVDGDGTFKVMLHDGQEIPAKVVGRDRRTDVAVIRLEKVPGQLVAARLGDSSKIEVGEWVLAVGTPLGMDQAVTAGIISSKGKVGRNMQMSGDRVREYIQTDAKINPGNSGGPLVNLNGEVVGVNTLIRVGAGGAYGFAVPINEAYRVAQLLLKDGRVKYPFLGVQVADLAGLQADIKGKLGSGAPEQGAYVGEVTPDSPAAREGIKRGDVITRMDDREIKEASDVVDHVQTRGIGAAVNVTVWREGSSRRLRATLIESPADPTEALGMSLQALTPPLARSLGLAPDTRGAAITEVRPDGPAAQAGLQPGDVILEIDRQPVTGVDQAVAALQDRRSGGHLLRVRGPRGVRFVVLRGG